MSTPNPGDGRVYNFAALREELDLVAGDENLPRSRQMAVATARKSGRGRPSHRAGQYQGIPQGCAVVGAPARRTMKEPSFFVHCARSEAIQNTQRAQVPAESTNSGSPRPWGLAMTEVSLFPLETALFRRRLESSGSRILRASGTTSWFCPLRGVFFCAGFRLSPARGRPWLSPQGGGRSCKADKSATTAH